MCVSIENLSTEQLHEKASELGIEECKYCKFRSDCKGGMSSDGGGNPVYPPCSDGEFDRYVDEDELYEVVKEGLENAES
jgi:hypothetical protein